MDKFVIHGGKSLNGVIKVNGAKNFALKILPASLLTDQEVLVSNIPHIEDVFCSLDLLRSVGVSVEGKGSHAYSLKAAQLDNAVLGQPLCSKIRTAILMVGPLLARCGSVSLSRSGGCSIGPRPQDIFLAGFRALGAVVQTSRNRYRFSAPHGLVGAKFVFPWISMTATEAMILAAVLAKGKTVLKNAACEPEIEALARFLNRRGAKIRGAGTSSVEIEGSASLLKGGRCSIMPDRIEAGSFVLLGLAGGGSVKVTGLNPSHLEVLWTSLEKAGANLHIGSDFVEIKPGSQLKAVNIRTHEYPGFPTDLQAPFSVLMTQAQGSSLIHETIFEKRLFYTDMLNKMGANIVMCDPHRVIIQGPTRLHGKRLVSPDIRAGIALVMAALVAQGQSVIENVYQIDRGYESLETRLQPLGAAIQRVSG